jgi:hypothetical protein
MQVFALLLGLGVIIGLLAIAFDGGSSLLQRRTMQNGAEAGAIGGVNYMGQHLAISCNPAPCHPTYFATNTELRTHIEGLVGANRGGTVGSPTYATTIEYHYISGHLPPVDECPSGPRRDLGYCPPPVNPEYPYVPEFVDGLAVTALVNNPTTFAGAMPQASDSVRVSAIAAARIYPTCRPEGEPGKTLPMTRFRPAVEYELYDPNRGNSICHPFAFWTSQPDVGNSIKNVMSFNNATLREHNNIDEQMITGFDNRMGPSPTGSGLSYYDHAQLWRTLQTCMLEPCVNMFNAGLRATDPPPPQPPTSGDMANWIFWQWQGVISTTTTVWNNTANSMTEYPSTRENGANGSGARPGDWAEIIGISGSYGQNIQDPVHDLALTAADRITFTASLPVNQGGLNWGTAVRRTIYVWGPEADNVLTGRLDNNDTAAQVWDTWETQEPLRCSPRANEPQQSGWTDLTVDGQYNQNNNRPDYRVTNENCNGNGGPNDIERVNFTESYDFLFFANLQGNYGAIPAAGCPSLPNDGSSAYGILPAPFVPEPPPGGGGCGGGWDPLGGAYGQQVDPNT